MVESDERGVPRIEGHHVVRLLDARLEAALLGHDARGDAPRLPFEEEQDAPQASLNGADRRDRPDREERIGADGLSLGDLALRDREDAAFLVVQGRFDGAERRRAAGGDGEADPRKQNGVLHRNDRKNQTFRHRPLSPERLGLLAGAAQTRSRKIRASRPFGFREAAAPDYPARFRDVSSLSQRLFRI